MVLLCMRKLTLHGSLDFASSCDQMMQDFFKFMQTMSLRVFVREISKKATKENCSWPLCNNLPWSK